jgi:hypothetical protein
MKENELNICCNFVAKLRKFWHVWHPFAGYLAHTHTHTHTHTHPVKNHCYGRTLNMQTVKSEL